MPPQADTDFQLDSIWTQEELQCEIIKAKSRLSHLHGLQNLRFGGPAARIMPELLTLIFEELVLDDTNIVPYPPSRKARISGPRNHHPCLPLSHVCRYWRRVALDSPRLWGILYTNCSLRWFDFVSERAMNAHLYLRRSVDVEAIDDVGDFGLPLEDCLGRFKEIHLDDATTDQTSWAQVIINGNTPMLEVLEICMGPNSYYHVPRYYSIAAVMKPHLRVLRTINCTVNVGAGCLSSLQELFVDLEDIAPSLSAADVLESLHSLQSLRSLDLRYVLIDDDDVSINLTLRLPHLSHLSISVRRWIQLSLIQHIVAPKLESLQLCCSQYFHESSTPSTILDPICRYLFPAPPQPQRVTLDHNRESCYSIFRAFLSPSPSISSTSESCHRTLTSLALEFTSDEDMRSERDISQCPSLPFRNPTVLSVSTRPYSPDRSFPALSRDFLCFLTQVEDVYLGDADAVNLFAAAARSYFNSSATTTHMVMPLPALKNLTLFIGEEEELDMPDFGALLHQRSARGAPIVNLTIFGSHLDYSLAVYVETFRAISTDSEEYKEYPNFLVN